MPASHSGAIAQPRHALLFELIRQENLSDRVSSKLKLRKRRTPARDMQQKFLERANQSWKVSRP